jgi:hypothetical protein
MPKPFLHTDEPACGDRDVRRHNGLWRDRHGVLYPITQMVDSYVINAANVCEYELQQHNFECLTTERQQMCKYVQRERDTRGL